jgi:hypothetical protein
MMNSSSATVKTVASLLLIGGFIAFYSSFGKGKVSNDNFECGRRG